MAALEDLQKAYFAKKEIYDIEFGQNSAGRVNAYAGAPYILPYNGLETDRTTFENWLKASDESLRLKKAAMDSAKVAYDTEVTRLAATAEADFKAKNPDKFFDLEKVKAEIAANQDTKVLAQKTTKYLIWGAVAIVVIIAGILIYKRKFSV